MSTDRSGLIAAIAVFTWLPASLAALAFGIELDVGWLAVVGTVGLVVFMVAWMAGNQMLDRERRRR